MAVYVRQLAIIWALQAVASTAMGNVLYVDGHATGSVLDGSSWCDAYRSLAAALDTAQPGDVVRIADGTYTPDVSTAPSLRHATFQLRSDVTIEGGYAGCGAADPFDRDPRNYETILSGDLNGNDGLILSGMQTGTRENCFHVVTASGVTGSTVVDGVVISSGRADGLECYYLRRYTGQSCVQDSDCISGVCREKLVCFGGGNEDSVCATDADCPDGACFGGAHSTGGGVLNISGLATFSNCVFRDNFARFQGGGMQNKFTTVTLRDTEFVHNYAGDNGGALYNGSSFLDVADCVFRDNIGQQYAGGVCNRDQTFGTFLRCIFHGNQAAIFSTDTGGGAVVNASSSPSFIQCLFSENESVAGSGGAMYNKLGLHPELGPSSPILLHCEFYANTAFESGGAMYTIAAGNPFVEGCIFERNVASLYGGAVYNSGAGSEPVFRHCLFRFNRVVEHPVPRGATGGGAMLNIGSDPIITNCLFDRNESHMFGGAIYNYGSSPEITCCTVVGNVAMEYGGGLFNRTRTSFPTIRNSIYWGNMDRDGTSETAQIHQVEGAGTPAIDYSCVQGWTGAFGGTGNFSADVRFTPGPAGCHYLSHTVAGQTQDSPCIDAGGDMSVDLDLDELVTQSDEASDTGVVDIGFHYYAYGIPLTMGDYDRNQVIDLADFAAMQYCFTLPSHAEVSPCCSIFDFDQDDDVDLIDHSDFVAIWQLFLNNP